MTVVQDGAAGHQEPDKEFRELILSISRDKEERRGQERGWGRLNKLYSYGREKTLLLWSLFLVVSRMFASIEPCVSIWHVLRLFTKVAKYCYPFVFRPTPSLRAVLVENTHLNDSIFFVRFKTLLPLRLWFYSGSSASTKIECRARDFAIICESMVYTSCTPCAWTRLALSIILPSR